MVRFLLTFIHYELDVNNIKYLFNVFSDDGTEKTETANGTFEFRNGIPS